VEKKEMRELPSHSK